MTLEPTDPTAGRRAREAYRNPAASQPILDPTDPRYGRLQPRSATPPELVGPTDPRQGTRARTSPGHVYPRWRRRRAASGH
jgi:hypothetical protein